MAVRQSGTQADSDLRHALAAFERSVTGRPTPMIIGVLRSVVDLARFAIKVTFASGMGDPIHLQPRILRTV